MNKMDEVRYNLKQIHIVGLRRKIKILKFELVMLAFLNTATYSAMIYFTDFIGLFVCLILSYFQWPTFE